MGVLREEGKAPAASTSKANACSRGWGSCATKAKRQQQQDKCLLTRMGVLREEGKAPAAARQVPSHADGGPARERQPRQTFSRGWGSCARKADNAIDGKWQIESVVMTHSWLVRNNGAKIMLLFFVIPQTILNLNFYILKMADFHTWTPPNNSPLQTSTVMTDTSMARDLLDASWMFSDEFVAC